MGALIYGSPSMEIQFDDRVLAHVQIVMSAKLRRGENFFFSWRDSPSVGDGRSAIWIERISLSRSKGMRRPVRLTMTSSRSCTRSKVVKRPPHSGQRRRRRIAAPSSDGRESFTWLSS